MSVQQETLTAYYAGDPALAGVPREWFATRDPTALNLPLGADPVLYRFRRLTRTQRAFVYRAGTPEERFEWSFLAGIVSVVGGRFGTGGWHRKEQPDGVTTDIDEVEEVFAPAEMKDVGEWIYATSELGKGSAPRLPLSRTSRLALDASAPPSAEPNRE